MPQVTGAQILPHQNARKIRLPDMKSDDMSNGLQYLVADQMSISIVDSFKPVDIHDQQRHITTMSFPARKLLRYPLFIGTSVRDPSQGIADYHGVLFSYKFAQFADLTL